MSDAGKRNGEFTLERGRLYRIRSRNLPYGVYDGRGGFTGIREKFGDLSLFTEYDYDAGPPYGTVIVLDDLGAVPEGVDPSGRNRELYDFLVAAERMYGRGLGYGGRPGDTESSGGAEEE